MNQTNNLNRYSFSQQGGSDMDLILRTLIMSLAAAMILLLISVAVKLKQADLQPRHSDQIASITDIDRKIECMTRNIYYEASHEPPEGKIAVAQVVMNRAASSQFPDDVCQVIAQKTVFHSVVVCQFTWLCDGSVERRRISPAMWEESRVAAKKVLLEGFRLPSLENALFYHADYVNPRWRLDEVARIGRHIFYQPRQRNI
jgi:spore germination cell wall hydrolase CwlJ-like protein